MTSSSSKSEGSSTPKEVKISWDHPCDSFGLAVPQSAPSSVANAPKLVKKKQKASVINELMPNRQKIRAPSGLMKDARKLSKKGPSSNVIQQYKEGLSASLVEIISSEWCYFLNLPLFLIQASLYALKDYNEKTPALASAFVNQKKAKDAANKIAAKESLLLKAEIA
ncbi:hypothetical protein PanWU01x14_191990 [Parasponia andersonii]|uniref:Uncharacterized protein n=1 Tax=Parasponia andersonii TaxID=3476 RepID=A0A2P5C192_PARAD|nr:hypothetical protein PanWU01x14_191990 [Parasponia andersonii]